MKYNHWTKIDDGAEGAWAADNWIGVIKAIANHEGEQVYDADAAIYTELEAKVPDLKWRAYDNGSFRPYFRDFSKPWTLTETASFDGKFLLTEKGRQLASGKLSPKDLLISFLHNYEEDGEHPFRVLGNAFSKTEEPINLEQIYYCVIRSYRPENNDILNLNLPPELENIPSSAQRRTLLLLQLLERSGAILKVGKGRSQRWLQWDKSTLLKIITPPLVPQQNKPANTEAVALSKNFILLAGISGTGKTRFVRKQAEASEQFSQTYCLTSVRPDWHEPSDLLGYISRLNGNAEYITTDVLEFIAKAWRSIADSNLTIQAQEIDGQGNRLVVTGNASALEQVPPYWLCLDEMNLAPVEQYFSDYLSALETREWRWNGDTFTYSCDALLKPVTINSTDNQNKLREALGFENPMHDNFWELTCQYGLPIPFNLIVAGTVNMDETTHGFSRKVIDRALSFDFGTFFPNNYDAFFTPTSFNKPLSYPVWSHASKTDLAHTFDADGSKTVAFLSTVNAVLKNTPFELAFRALNELLLAVASSQPKDDLTLKAVWDDFMMCKVLPRIEGDTDKLRTSDGTPLLAALNTVLEEQLAPIWQAEKDNAGQRPDLYRVKAVDDGATEDEKVLHIPCRSKAKLMWMNDRLASATFTSFWP